MFLLMHVKNVAFWVSELVRFTELHKLTMFLEKKKKRLKEMGLRSKTK